MKKQYIVPAMQAQYIEVCHVIATSIQNTNVNGLNVHNSGTSGVVFTGNAKGRQEEGIADDPNGWTDGLW